jgi:hypothetical protein
MLDSPSVIAMMRQSLEPPSVEGIERVLTFSANDLAATLGELGVDANEASEIVDYWDELRRDETWVALLAALRATVEHQRGDIDAPIAIWPDLEDAGPSGRLLYFYLFALCCRGAREFLTDARCPEEIIDSTLGVLARHAAIHRRKWGTTGVDAGWWMLPTLRGEIVHIGSLQFHRVNLGLGTLSPDPWFTDDEMAALGEGFRRGDPSIGVHIPEGAALDPDRLDATFDDARTVLGTIWPVVQRRIATCQSWMLDDQLKDFLPASSNILAFQRRFTMLAAWVEDDWDTLEFVFRSPGVALGDLPRRTTLQRGIIEVLERGGHWRARTGWFDFDGIEPA